MRLMGSLSLSLSLSLSRSLSLSPSLSLSLPLCVWVCVRTNDSSPLYGCYILLWSENPVHVCLREYVRGGGGGWPMGFRGVSPAACFENSM